MAIFVGQKKKRVKKVEVGSDGIQNYGLKLTGFLLGIRLHKIPFSRLVDSIAFVYMLLSKHVRTSILFTVQKLILNSIIIGKRRI